MANFIGGFAVNVFVSYFVNASVGTNLYEYWQVKGKQLSPPTILRIIRLMVFVYTVGMYLAWGTRGLESVALYIIYRRCTYLFYAFLSAFVTPVIYWILLSKIVNVLGEKYKKNKQKVPIGVTYIQIIKYAILLGFGVPTTLQFTLRVIGNELFQHSLNYFQITCNFFFFFSSSMFSAYMIYKSLPAIVERAKSGTVQTNTN
ncbi:hypothetical protein HDV04_004608 [Boothiomyces sp. JEL0838]|nr:hypothetical protein HDV04_004608 [Boothiomyces sp. JEL0838]